MAIGYAGDLAAGSVSGGGVDWPRPATDLLLIAERIISAIGSGIDEKAMPVLAGELIELYDSPFGSCRSCRERAALATTILARRSRAALDRVRANAERYSDTQKKIDDAYPYSPNSLEILDEISPKCP